MNLTDAKLGLDLAINKLGYYTKSFLYVSNGCFADKALTGRRISDTEIKHLEMRVEAFYKSSAKAYQEMHNTIQALKEQKKN